MPKPCSVYSCSHGKTYAINLLIVNDNCVDLAKKNGQIHTKKSLTETFPQWYMESNIP